MEEAMKVWNIKIRAIVEKTIKVTEEDCKTEEEAVELAHTLFTTASDGTAEKYEQDTVHVMQTYEK